MAPLIGALTTQAGAFSPVRGPDAIALSHAPQVHADIYYNPVAYGGNVGWLRVHGVADVPTLMRGFYGGIAPANPLSPALERPNPWTSKQLLR